MEKNRYTPNGTVFYDPYEKEAWAVQIEYNLGGGGAPFKTLKWATWSNEFYLMGFQETNEDPDMYGWKVATDADIILYATPEIADKIRLIKNMVEFGYTGKHSTRKEIIDELEWRFIV